MNRTLWLAGMLVWVVGPPPLLHAQPRYPAAGLVLKIDRPLRTMTVSCEEIPGFMAAMVMPFSVRSAQSLENLQPGMMIEFTLVVTKQNSYAENVHLRSYHSAEREPAKAERLETFEKLIGGKTGSPRIGVGQVVPEFTLTDQKSDPVRLSQFAGKVVALNFVYTRCVLPDYCFRLSNHFGQLQKRFRPVLGRDLILLTVTFDPVHDRPDILDHYAETWKANHETWHFLTGSAADVQRVCDMFGVGFFPDEGLVTHSLHTAIIDRQGKLVTNLEGNQFTEQELGDMIQTVLDRPR